MQGNMTCGHVFAFHLWLTRIVAESGHRFAVSALLKQMNLQHIPAAELNHY